MSATKKIKSLVGQRKKEIRDLGYWLSMERTREEFVELFSSNFLLIKPLLSDEPIEEISMYGNIPADIFPKLFEIISKRETNNNWQRIWLTSNKNCPKSLVVEFWNSEINARPHIWHLHHGNPVLVRLLKNHFSWLAAPCQTCCLFHFSVTKNYKNAKTLLCNSCVG